MNCSYPWYVVMSTHVLLNSHYTGVNRKVTHAVEYEDLILKDSQCHNYEGYLITIIVDMNEQFRPLVVVFIFMPLMTPNS